MSLIKALQRGQLTGFLAFTVGLMFGVQPCLPATENSAAVPLKRSRPRRLAGGSGFRTPSWSRTWSARRIRPRRCIALSSTWCQILRARANKRCRSLLKAAAKRRLIEWRWNTCRSLLRPAESLPSRTAQNSCLSRCNSFPSGKSCHLQSHGPGSRPDAILATHPHYPMYAREHYNQGACRIRVTFPGAGGRPKEVALISGSGSNVLDANSLLHILENWDSPPSPTKQDYLKNMELVYQLRR